MVSESIRRASGVARLAIVLSLALPCAFPLDPAKPISQYRHDVWQEAEGLPHYSINAILQTRSGYLWLATYYGLVRFDGVQFTVFDKNSSPALPGNTLWALAEDAAGALWIGSSSGLARFDATGVKSFGPKEGLPSQSIKALHFSRSGKLWIGTYDGGLAYYESGRIVKAGLDGQYVRAIYEDGNGALWAGTRAGLYRIQNGQTTRYTVKDGLPADHVFSLLEDSNGVLWAGTHEGVCRLRNGRFEVLSHPALTRQVIWSLRQDRDGSLWIGTFGNGLVRYSGGRVTAYSDSDRLSSRLITALYEDREGSLWIGASGGGLSRFRDVAFTTFSARDGLGGNVVQSLAAARNGDLWIGLNGGGINRLRDGKLEPFGFSDGLSNDAIWSLLEDRSGTIWAGTFGGGLNVFRNGRFRAYTTKDGLSNDNVFALHQGRSGDLWVGTYGGGLNRFRDGKFTVYGERDGLPSNEIRVIHEDRGGTLWVGSRNGLSRLEDGRFVTFTARNGLHNEFVMSIYEDADGAFWLGTFGGGLVRFHRGKFTSFDRTVLPSEVFHVLEDDRGWLWLSSAQGIFAVQKKELNDVAEGRGGAVHPLSYGIAEGMNTRECASGQPAACRTRDGRLWFATVRGLSVVDPRRLFSNPLPPPVAIERMLVDGRSYPISRAVELPAGSGNLELQYTALSLLAPKKVRFRYRLEGYDREWIDGGNRRQVWYTNLRPGAYRFRVTAANNDGVWNQQGATLAFTLQPRFYQTGAFVALCTFVALLLLGVAHLFRLRRLLRRNQELETRVAERTSATAAANLELSRLVAELEAKSEQLEVAKQKAEQASQVKSEFVANMSHEIRTPMNGIMGMTSLALRTSLTPEQKEYLDLIDFSANSLLALLNNVLDFSRIDAGRMEIDAVDFSLRKCLDDTLRILDMQAQEKELAVGYQAGAGVPDAVRGDPVRLRQVLLNLIGNAIKFTDRGSISVRVEKEFEEAGEVVLHFSVQDSGIGIPSEKQRAIFEPFQQADVTTSRNYGGTGLGLSICSRLVALMRGRIWVDSEPGVGSTFHFTAWLGLASGPIDDPSIPGAQLLLCPPMHILLAEDNLISQRFAAVLLKEQGHTVVVAGNGLQVLQLAQTQRFDLILMDVQMPEMDGFAATAAIRERERVSGGHMTILAMTAHAMQGDRERCLAAGMDGYISKPVSPRELTKTIAEFALQDAQS